MGYLRRLWGKIGEFSIRAADVLGLTFPPIVAFGLWVVGRDVSDDLTSALIVWIGGGLLVAAALRLLAAPYLVWQDDQSTIKDLERALDDPRRQRRAALVAHFAAARAQLVKQLFTILGDLRELNAAFDDAAKAARDLYQLASPFLTDAEFKKYWFTFEQHMKGVAAVRQWAKTKRSEENLDVQDAALRRYSVHYVYIDIAVNAMAHWVSETDDHRVEYARRMEETATMYGEPDYSFAPPPIEGFHEVDWWRLRGDAGSS